MIEHVFEDLLAAGAVVTAAPGELRFSLTAGDDLDPDPYPDPDSDFSPDLDPDLETDLAVETGWVRREITATDVLDFVVGGPAGPAAISMLLSVQGEPLNELDQALVLQGWLKQVSFCEAQALAASIPVAEHPLSAAFGAHEVAAVSGTTVTAADRRLSLAHRLAAVLTRTGESLVTGAISFTAARILHEQTLGLTPAQAREVEAKVLDRAGRILPASLRDAVNKAVAAIDPERFDRQQQEAATHTPTSPSARCRSAWPPWSAPPAPPTPRSSTVPSTTGPTPTTTTYPPPPAVNAASQP